MAINLSNCVIICHLGQLLDTYVTCVSGFGSVSVVVNCYCFILNFVAVVLVFENNS